MGTPTLGGALEEANSHLVSYVQKRVDDYTRSHAIAWDVIAYCTQIKQKTGQHTIQVVIPPLKGWSFTGEIDAAIGAGAIDSPDIKPLFPDADEADADWFKSTGVYPISHMLVVKNDRLEQDPWLAEELFALFRTAKSPYLEFLHSGAQLSPSDQSLSKMSKLVGKDPIPYGFEEARKTLETFVRFNVEQKVIPQRVDPEELFPASTLALS